MRTQKVRFLACELCLAILWVGVLSVRATGQSPKLPLAPAPVGPPSDNVRILHPVRVIHTDIPAFGGDPNPDCDQDGDSFAQIEDFVSLKEKTWVLLNHDLSQPRVVSLPPGFREHTGPSIDVGMLSRGGRIFILHQTLTNAQLLAYSSSGEFISAHPIPIPSGWEVSRAATLDDGTLALIATRIRGQHSAKETKDSDPEKGEDLSELAAVYAPDGHLVADLSNSANGKVDHHFSAKSLPMVDITQGDDGNFYWLTGTDIRQVTRFGELRRTFTARFPWSDDLKHLIAPEPIPIRLLASRNQLLVVFENARPGELLKIKMQVLDTQTGETIGYFRPDPELGNALVCFSASGELTFDWYKNQKIVRYITELK